MLSKSKSPNPLKSWQVDRDRIKYLGKDLQRRDCILLNPNGMIWTADARGGVVTRNVCNFAHIPKRLFFYSSECV